MRKRRGEPSKPSINTTSNTHLHTPIVPLGIKVLVQYTSVLALFYFILIFSDSDPIFLGLNVSAIGAKIINVLFLLLLILMIYGFMKRESWVFYLSAGVYIISIVNSIINMLTIGNYPSLYELRSYIIPAYLFIIFLNIMTLYYIYHKKDYFLTKRYPLHIKAIDTAFVYSIYFFYLALIAFILVMGIGFYDTTTKIIDKVLPEINGKTATEALSICGEKSDDSERDLCYLTTVVLNKEDKRLSMVCDDINSKFYKFTCYRALG